MSAALIMTYTLLEIERQETKEAKEAEEAKETKWLAKTKTTDHYL